MKRRVIAVILVGLLCLASISFAYALVSENYNLSWNVIGGGGSAMDSASYGMRSTVGQIIGLSSSDNYQLGAGYWNGISAVPMPTKFDTGHGTYPSIFGTHNGTIKPNQTITVDKLYTYPCAGTGGHSEYVAFYNATTGAEMTNGTWNGYQGAGDYHYIEFAAPVTLEGEVTYSYCIRTGSYPQIIHNQTLTNAYGTINCTEFVDANGKRYEDWIPAIRLCAE